MNALTIIGSIILAFFLWVGTKVSRGEDGEGVSPSTVIALIIIIALAGFLIAAGLFS